MESLKLIFEKLGLYFNYFFFGLVLVLIIIFSLRQGKNKKIVQEELPKIEELPLKEEKKMIPVSTEWRPAYRDGQTISPPQEPGLWDDQNVGYEKPQYSNI